MALLEDYSQSLIILQITSVNAYCKKPNASDDVTWLHWVSWVFPALPGRGGLHVVEEGSY